VKKSRKLWQPLNGDTSGKFSQENHSEPVKEFKQVNPSGNQIIQVTIQ
jgi:hypothetical protein